MQVCTSHEAHLGSLECNWMAARTEVGFVIGVETPTASLSRLTRTTAPRDSRGNAGTWSSKHRSRPGPLFSRCVTPFTLHHSSFHRCSTERASTMFTAWERYGMGEWTSDGPVR